MSDRIKRIFLIRHAESEGNVNKAVHTYMADHAIPLSTEGFHQADEAGKFLVGWLEENVRTEKTADYTLSVDSVRLWNSPYLRTRQTSDVIATRLGMGAPKQWLCDRAESILLCEQQFGLFDGIPDEELPVLFPREHAHYKKCEDFEGRFWARYPQGESRFDVAQRVHQFFGTLQRDCERHAVQNVAIVSHGVTNRAFRMMWMHHKFEWFEAEPNPGNCSITLIEWDRTTSEYVDHGCIFQGFKPVK